MPNQPTPPDPTRPEPTEPAATELTVPSPEPAEASPLAARLLRRHTEALGLIDVKHAARHHARLTRWLADRFELLEQLRTRYAVDDDATPNARSLLLQRAGAQTIPSAGLAPPSPVPPTAPNAFPPPTFPPQTFVAPPAAADAGAPPPTVVQSAAASAPVEQPAPPPTTFRVSRDSAARASRRNPRPDAPKSDAPKSDAPTPSAPPAAKPADLPRAAEQTHASRSEPTESRLVMREAARGRAPEANEAADNAPPPGESRGVDELELQRPRRGEAGSRAPDVPPHTDAPTHADAVRKTPTVNDGVVASLPVARAEVRAPQVSPPALPLIARREPGSARGDLGAARGEVSPPAATTTAAETNLPRVSERDARADDTSRATHQPHAPQARPDADLPLASARLPSPDATRPAPRPGEEVGVGRDVPGVGRVEPGTPVSAEVRDGAAAGPPEIVWRKGGGRTTAGVAESAGEEHRESHPTTTHSSGARPAGRPGESHVAGDAATPTTHAPEVNLGRLTDSVMRAITRRLAVERERRGMRP